jgi:hypothetical protein
VHAGLYSKQLTVESSQPVELVLRLMSYPAWRVEVNGKRITPQSDDSTGRMIIPVPAGHSEVDVRFIRTPDRWLGDGLSLGALLFLCAFWYVERGSALAIGSQRSAFNDSTRPTDAKVR